MRPSHKMERELMEWHEGYTLSNDAWAELADEFQRVADERRIKEIRRRDEQPMVIGLAILAALAIFTFFLIGFGLMT